MTGTPSIHSLPTEIKTRIAELCRLQDETIAAVFYDLRDIARDPCVHHYNLDDEYEGSDDEETDQFKLGPFSDGRFDKRTYPKSLLSLSCVSKEWRDIALKILLRKVTGRTCSDPIFLCAIAPEYGHLVEELEIDLWPESCSALNILFSLAYLSNVRTVALPSVARMRQQLATQGPVSGLPTQSASPAFVSGALRRVVQHASVVTLPPMKDLADTILCIRGAALSTLKLVVAEGDLPAVLETIQTCPNLHTLAIGTYGVDNRIFENAASLPYPRHPTLRRLDVSDPSGGHRGLYDFIHHFFPNLEELSFSLYAIGVSEIATPPDLVRFNLPRLQHLEVKGSLAFSAPLIRHISPLTFPALHACTWVLPYAHQPHQRETFVAQVIDSIGHLRDQQVGRAVPVKAAIDFHVEYNRTVLQPGLEALGITEIGAKQGAGGGSGGGIVVGLAAQSPMTITRPADPPGLILTPRLYRNEESPNKDKVEDLGNIISGSLDRIRNLKDAAVAVGDRFQISRIAEALQEGEWLCVERQC